VAIPGRLLLHGQIVTRCILVGSETLGGGNSLTHASSRCAGKRMARWNGRRARRDLQFEAI
jgi:hypothetical protein